MLYIKQSQTESMQCLRESSYLKSCFAKLKENVLVVFLLCEIEKQKVSDSKTITLTFKVQNNSTQIF